MKLLKNNDSYYVGFGSLVVGGGGGSGVAYKAYLQVVLASSKHVLRTLKAARKGITYHSSVCTTAQISQPVTEKGICHLIGAQKQKKK